MSPQIVYFLLMWHNHRAMRSFTVPFGPAGWKEKKALLEELITSRPRPPFLFHDILILVPSSRLKRVYGRLFLDVLERIAGAQALVPPDIQTIHQFLQKHFALLQGPRLIDETSRLVLLEGLIKEQLSRAVFFGRNPDLLAPSLSTVVAKMIEELSAAGIGPEELRAKAAASDFSDKPQVALLVDVYSRYQRTLADSRLVDPAGMRIHILDHFQPAWLASYSRVLVEGNPVAGSLETALLKTIAGCSDCTAVLEAPSPDLVNKAGDAHPLRLLRDFAATLGITIASEPAEAGGDYIASCLFSDKPFSVLAEQAPAPSSFLQSINLLSAVNPREEVSFIAGEVKASLQAGTRPDTILVAFPALDDYGPLVAELFTDYGIPFNRALGRQLSTSAVAAALISLLTSLQQDFSGPSLLRVFSSPFLKFGRQPGLSPALDRFLRRWQITGGRQRLLSQLKHRIIEGADHALLREPLLDLFSALEPFAGSEPRPLSRWMDLLSGLVSWSGMNERVDRIKGALNINLQAYKKIGDCLASLAHAGRMFPAYRYTFNEWLFLLRKTFMHARFQVPPGDEGGVQVLGFEETPGQPWSEIYLGGLTDGRFPQRLPQNIFLPEQALESMGIRTRERARLTAAAHFYRLVLSAPRILLTWPENEGDRPLAPSPFLAELSPLKQAGLLNRGFAKTSGIQFSMKIEDSRSVPELAKAITLAEYEAVLEAVLTIDRDGIPPLRSAMAGRQPEPPKSAPLMTKNRFRVTELDGYINCPYKYYISSVLGILPLEEVTEDLSLMGRGSTVHAILKDFYRAWDRPVTRERIEDARAVLQRLADSAFDAQADTFRNRREKALFLTVMAERFLDAEIRFWNQGMRPVFLEQKIEGYPLSLSDGREVELSAVVDRIDMDGEGNFIIVDYKTGKYPDPKEGTDQEIFQLPVYAVMAMSGLAGKEPGLKKAIGLAYYDLSGRTRGGARDLVLFNRDARDDHPCAKPKASPKTEAEFEDILAKSMDKARRAVESILAGRFPEAPLHADWCRHCPNEMLCRDDEKQAGSEQGTVNRS
jgi:inactivated superfamily I helicase/RecB family exonuclease